MGLRILGDRVMIKVDDAPETEGGIILPETAQEKPQRGTVVAVGTGDFTDSDIRAETLSKITVSGRIRGDGHEICADLGLFSIKDGTGTWKIGVGGDVLEHMFEGLRAYVA